MNKSGTNQEQLMNKSGTNRGTNQEQAVEQGKKAKVTILWCPAEQLWNKK